MNKELTPLEAFNNIKNITYDRTDLYGIEVFRKDLDIIETALKETEMLKECYKNELKNSAYYNNLALKYKRALEIIKREPSEVIEIITTYDTWEEYIKDYPISDRTIWHIIKNKSEFDLLKEILL